MPVEDEEREPAFVHYPALELPQVELPGVTVRVIMGAAYGERSPVNTYSRTLYLDCLVEAGATLTLPDDEQELALYVAEGSIDIEGETHGAGVMAVACPGGTLELCAAVRSRVMVIGGDALGARNIFWNFVHSSVNRIEQAKEDWREGRFPAVPGDDEFIPLPE